MLLLVPTTAAVERTFSFDQTIDKLNGLERTELMKRIKIWMRSNLWLVVPTAGFIVLAYPGEILTASRPDNRSNAESGLTEFGAARRLPRRVHASDVHSPSVAADSVTGSHVAAGRSYGYGIGDNSRNQTW